PFSLGVSEMGATVHGPDPEVAQRYFRRAKVLDPSIDLPEVRSRTASDAPSLGHVDLVMPGIDIPHASKDEMLTESMQLAQKRRRKDKDSWLLDDDSLGPPILANPQLCNHPRHTTFMSTTNLAAPSSAARITPLKESANESVVGIFWDYESCPSPSKHSQSACIEAIHKIAMFYGSIRAFNLYIDINGHPEIGQTTVLREQLHDSGGSVLDCPAGNKTIADKMIIVDLFAFAIRNRVPSTLVVLSTDPDLAYTLSLLRQRRFKVVLVTSDRMLSHSALPLKPQADACFSWTSSPLGDILAPIAMGASASTFAVASSLASQPVVSMPRALPPLISVAPVGITSVQSQSNRITTAQVSHPPTSSLLPSLDTPTVSRTATSVITSTQVQTGQSRSSDPEYLKVLVEVLSRAKKPRGWEVEYVYHRLGRRPEARHWDMGTMSQYLAEAVRLGILVRSVAVSKKAKQEHFYFAVNGAYKIR
ncbi:hypothetical protein FRB90_011316, partial [Tulasnella sp. 427]